MLECVECGSPMLERAECGLHMLERVECGLPMIELVERGLPMLERVECGSPMLERVECGLFCTPLSKGQQPTSPWQIRHYSSAGIDEDSYSWLLFQTSSTPSATPVQVRVQRFQT